MRPTGCFGLAGGPLGTRSHCSVCLLIAWCAVLQVGERSQFTTGSKDGGIRSRLKVSCCSAVAYAHVHPSRIESLPRVGRVPPSLRLSPAGRKQGNPTRALRLKREGMGPGDGTAKGRDRAIGPVLYPWRKCRLAEGSSNSANQGCSAFCEPSGGHSRPSMSRNSPYGSPSFGSDPNRSTFPSGSATCSSYAHG